MGTLFLTHLVTGKTFKGSKFHGYLGAQLSGRPPSRGCPGQVQAPHLTWVFSAQRRPVCSAAHPGPPWRRGLSEWQWEPSWPVSIKLGLPPAHMHSLVLNSSFQAQPAYCPQAFPPAPNWYPAIASPGPQSPSGPRVCSASPGNTLPRKALSRRHRGAGTAPQLGCLLRACFCLVTCWLVHSSPSAHLKQ